MLRTTIAALAALTFGATAHAGTVYATDIDWANNGTVGSSNDRDNPLNALGAPDNKFVSLGLSNGDGSNPGFAVFDFGGTLASGLAQVWEVTFGCSTNGCTHYPESVEVWVGTDYMFGTHNFADVMDDFTFAGELFNSDAQMGTGVLINQAFRYIALVDSSKKNFPFGPSTDGFDVDSVAVNSVPVPAAALLMAPALIALARRKRKV